MILMGVVNLTPDSFREDTRAMTAAAVRRRVESLLERGCGIIDFGAVSTRPGAAPVPIETEWQRLQPAIDLICTDGRLAAAPETGGIPSQDLRHPGSPEKSGDFSGNHPRLRGRGPSFSMGGSELPGSAGSAAVKGGIPSVSVDTTSAEIVQRVYGRIGRFIVNDISAGEDDPQMLPTVAELGLPYIAMHKRGNPRSMDSLTDYPQGVVAAVDGYFRDFAARAEELGVSEWILDPGFGFAKSAEQNWELLENLPALRHFGRPILVGVADKRFTRTSNPFAAEGPASGSAYAERLAGERGADILRIH